MAIQTKFHDIFLYVILPVLAIAFAFAVTSGKVGKAAVIGLGVIGGAAFMFITAGQLSAIGTWAAGVFASLFS